MKVLGNKIDLTIIVNILKSYNKSIHLSIKLPSNKVED